MNMGTKLYHLGQGGQPRPEWLMRKEQETWLEIEVVPGILKDSVVMYRYSLRTLSCFRI